MTVDGVIPAYVRYARAMLAQFATASLCALGFAACSTVASRATISPPDVDAPQAPEIRSDSAVRLHIVGRKAFIGENWFADGAFNGAPSALTVLAQRVGYRGAVDVNISFRTSGPRVEVGHRRVIIHLAYDKDGQTIVSAECRVDTHVYPNFVRMSGVVGDVFLTEPLGESETIDLRFALSSEPYHAVLMGGISVKRP